MSAPPVIVTRYCEDCANAQSPPPAPPQASGSPAIPTPGYPASMAYELRCTMFRQPGLDYVTKVPVYFEFRYCYEVRADKAACGPHAKHFKAKLP